MVYVCLVCKQKYRQDHSVSFHMFPEDEGLRKAWMTSLKLINEDLSKKQLRVCSNHFLKSDFIWNFGKLSLRPGAIPFRTVSYEVFTVTPDRRLLEPERSLEPDFDPLSLDNIKEEPLFEDQPGPSTFYPEELKVDSSISNPEKFKVESISFHPEELKVESITFHREEIKVELPTSNSEEFIVDSSLSNPEEFKVESITFHPEELKVESITFHPEELKVESPTSSPEELKVESITFHPEELKVESPTSNLEELEGELSTSNPEELECELSTSNSEELEGESSTSNPQRLEFGLHNQTQHNLPRYYGDCKESMLKNPQFAKHIWKIFSRTICQQRSTIKNLQNKNRCLRSKIESQTDLVNQLKKIKK